jgi:hypothetical protein
MKQGADVRRLMGGFVAEGYMQNLTQEQYQWLWERTKDATELNRLAVRAWLHELLVNEGYEVAADVVVKLA